MPTKRYGTEQIVSKLRQAEVELGRGLRVPQMCKQLGISEQTYYRWRKEYGGLRLDQAKWLKELERENARWNGCAAGRAQGAPETAETGAALAGGWVVCPPASAVSPSRVGV